MCGIAGYSTIGSQKTVDPQAVVRMIQALRHRGPDDFGYSAYPQAAFANSRLSIIDLSGGHQPITNHDDTVEIVYNGELYNAPELSAELKQKGYTFKTRSDTEVLLHLYEEEGPDFVKRLNGMFAYCIHDRRHNRILIGRDRFGVKPLVYFYRDGMLAFASEIKALKVLPEFNSELDPEAVSVFLGLFYIPDPWTIYKNVRKLKPGHYLMLTEGGLNEYQYFDYSFAKCPAISQREAEDQAATLLRTSIKRQLLSDVPVGVLLSGGLDSRSVLAAAAESNPGTHSYTITFSESLFNEGSEAQRWSELFNCPHHPMLFSEQQFCERILGRQKHLDEPYALWCNVATEALAEFINKSGCKVVLSGEGGDELFLGYPTINAAFAAKQYRLLPRILRQGLKSAVNRLPAGAGRLPLSFIAKSFVNADHPDFFRTFYGFKEVVRYEFWPSLLTPEGMKFIGAIDPYIAFRQYAPNIRGLHYIDALSYLDCKVFLPGCSFVGNDNAYMSHSVETRVPFMDNDLVDFATSLPVDVRFHPFQVKRVLKASLQRHFPPPAGRTNEFVRYKKKGFEVPGNEWLHGARFQRLISECLAPERLNRIGFFRTDAVDTIVRQQLSGQQNHERILQAIMSLVLFLDGCYDSIDLTESSRFAAQAA